MPRKNHILDALQSIAKAQQELEQTVTRHEKIIESQGKDIAALDQKVMELRNSAIQAEIALGIPSRDVAIGYNISAARVSQIAPHHGLQ